MPAARCIVVEDAPSGVRAGRAAGMRVVAPDLVGFGRSDKLEDAADYSYFNHVQWMKAWVELN